MNSLELLILAFFLEYYLPIDIKYNPISKIIKEIKLIKMLLINLLIFVTPRLFQRINVGSGAAINIGHVYPFKYLCLIVFILQVIIIKIL
jgi:hypothetical protein